MARMPLEADPRSQASGRGGSSCVATPSGRGLKRDQLVLLGVVAPQEAFSNWQDRSPIKNHDVFDAIDGA
eukprot:680954-Pyramimonas_sp.AAC.1